MDSAKTLTLMISCLHLLTVLGTLEIIIKQNIKTITLDLAICIHHIGKHPKKKKVKCKSINRRGMMMLTRQAQPGSGSPGQSLGLLQVNGTSQAGTAPACRA